MENKPTAKTEDKKRQEAAKLAENLRANLRRRKQVKKDSSSGKEEKD